MATEDEENRCYDFILAAVKDAGRVVREAYDQPSSRCVMTKATDTDLVTETDQKVENMLFSGLAAEFPGHQFIGEESTSGGKKIEYTDDPTWIIDPIDGTTNFVHRIPFIAICVGLAVRKELRIGIVYNPITEELFSARKGQGAYKNGFPIHASKTKELTKSVMAFTFGKHNIGLVPDWLDVGTANCRRLVEVGSRGQRSLGSAAVNMVYVAQGSLDAYIEYGIHCWDIAAAALICTEAGAVCRNPDGTPLELMRRCVLTASTDELATSISNVLTHVQFESEG